jgi:RNA polymerase sigma-70 factor (ECF subfamily)
MSAWSSMAAALEWPPVLACAGPPAAPAGQEQEREAILACQRGEREAFDRLVERYQRDVYRLCYRYVNNHEDANDMAQEVFLKAYRALGRFRGESAFSTWLYRIAVNTCLSFRSSRKPAGEEVTEALPDASPGALDKVEREETARIVRDAVRRLPEKQRATLILKVYHDLSHEEVAAILGSTVGTVKANLFHALGNLRRLLGTEAGG